jgi:two-component system response regulator HydG
MQKILVIDDDMDICNLLDRFLSKHGYAVKTAYNPSTAFGLIKNTTFDLVLSDFRLGHSDGREILKAVKEKDPTTQVIIITGYSDVKIAVDVIKMGAFDYITKPLLPDEILLLVDKALNKTDDVRSGKESISGVTTPAKGINGSSNGDPDYITGISPQAKEIDRQIMLVAPTPYSVIIYGESGTGKESIAHAIHMNSSRRTKPFIAVDCGALTKELAGSELFGHEKGAFTGALTQKIGHFESANGGTIFLDEVANLPYDTQVALLRVVQERKVRRLGGLKEIEIDVRILVASNERLSDGKKFREDLYHRFNEFSINLYPLRERGKDIEMFANHFLKKACSELGKQINSFSPEVISVFQKYRWPGNLRELNNVVKRVALLTSGDEVRLNSLPHEISFGEKFSFDGPAHLANEESPNKLKSVALNAEYEKILEILKQVNYNKSKAAKMLDIDRKTLYNKLKQYKIM